MVAECAIGTSRLPLPRALHFTQCLVGTCQHTGTHTPWQLTHHPAVTRQHPPYNSQALILEPCSSRNAHDAGHRYHFAPYSIQHGTLSVHIRAHSFCYSQHGIVNRTWPAPASSHGFQCTDYSMHAGSGQNLVSIHRYTHYIKRVVPANS